MEKHIYIFSGLGADERVFQHLDLSGFSTTYITWDIPSKDETIEEYATRLLSQIKTKRPILIGLSFGGMIAAEVAKQIDTEKVIFIASAKNESEIPFYYRLLGRSRFHKIVPAYLLKRSNFITNWFFGVTDNSDKLLLKNILATTHPVFMKWAIDKVVTWKNQTEPKNSVHIHGTADRILPYRYVACSHRIVGGGHFMTINKAQELESKIRELLL